MAQIGNSEFKKVIDKNLMQLRGVLAATAIGDFSKNVVIPKEETPFTELFVGLQLVLETVREKITELKKLNDALRKKEDALKEAQELAHLGSYELDLKTHNSPWSDELYRVFGQDKKKFTPSYEKVIPLIHPDHREMVEKAVTNTIKTGRPFEYEHIIMRPDGKHIWAYARGKLVRDEKGNPVKIIGIVQDITTQKEIERAKSEFLSIASHQLRTPLSTIKWYSKMLSKGDAGELNAKQRKYSEYISHASSRMAGLINSLLNVSRIELGTMRMEISKTSLAEIAASVVGELAAELHDKKLKIKEKYAEIPKIQSDPKLIRIIFQNIISNAVHYTPKKGKIEVSLELKGNDILFKVKDNGYGIPIEAKQKIFTKLYRAENVKKAVQDGTGLGLYITKSIVENIFRGKVWFESELNKGTTFYVLIPKKGIKKTSIIKDLL